MQQTEKKVEAIDLLSLFPAPEGVITQYYGRIGNGKTYLATRDVLRDLSEGKVVYTNWIIDYKGYDERRSFRSIVLSLLLFWRHRFYYFPKDNLRFINVDENFIKTFEKLTDCKVYLDEGHVVFDSYQMAKMSLRDRKAVLHTRHYDRSINIISQRPTNIHVQLRDNVNIFYKCEKLFQIGRLILFRRTEFQDMKGGEPDPDEPMSRRYYFGRRAIMEAYNSKYLRGDTLASQYVHFEAFDASYWVRLKFFFAFFRRAPKGPPKT